MFRRLFSPKTVESSPRRPGPDFVTKQDLAKLTQFIMIEFDTLTAQVKANTDVEASAVLLIQGIAAKLEAAKTDPAAIQALADELKASADPLAAAVAANTPAE